MEQVEVGQEIPATRQKRVERANVHGSGSSTVTIRNHIDTREVNDSPVQKSAGIFQDANFSRVLAKASTRFQLIARGVVR